jgi:SNF2 family DNA or RNA helicase
VVTTYGTLKADIEKLKDVSFDVAIVDEAQAIKNAKSQAAMATKMIKAELRIALTGTPIENSINDLLSILEYTNPGLLGSTEIKGDTQAALAKVLKPFMLRRTKEKVLTELPERSEQVLYCEMSAEERSFYVAIREKYKASLAEKIDKTGLGKSKLHVLEALLRLRQAASHSGLVDPKRANEPSAKIEQLIQHMQEVISEGHKVLVFSQFTSLLALVKTRLDEEQIEYEYLDGQTEDRKTPVDRFQTDPEVSAFLISLKAGGTGLNLTAADYVFILDPWWNPAVEAQAIGRAHRMGQTNKVIAYRMIARGTVEEKILDLQKTKKDLAESIVSEDQDFMKKLTKEDLEMLLD